MTLDKHKLEGLKPIKSRTLPAIKFEQRLQQAGYAKRGSAPAKGKRIKVWWYHPKHAWIEAIYSPNQKITITAYHIKKKPLHLQDQN
jgi:hypothetical protein